MAEISYQQLASHLKDLDKSAGGGGPAVYLIHGEDLIVASVFDEILRRLLPAAQGSLNYEPFDGASADIGDVLAAVNTFSLMPGTKVVALRDARIFHTKEAAPGSSSRPARPTATATWPRPRAAFCAPWASWARPSKMWEAPAGATA